MYKLFLFALLVASSCGTSNKTSKEVTNNTSSEVVAAVQQGSTTLALDEQKQIGDVYVHFKEVLEDSRCPKGVNCVWQGRAKLLVALSEDGMTVDQSEIIFGKLKSGEEENHTFYKSESLTITAMAINPYPTSETQGKDLSYELVLDVTSK